MISRVGAGEFDAGSVEIGRAMHALGFFRRLLPRHSHLIGRARTVEWSSRSRLVYHDVPASFRDRFVAAGYKPSHFFSHRIHCLPKCGPDGYLLASRMCGARDPDRMWQIVLYATGAALEEFPGEMFLDPDLAWHRQHFNIEGQVASASLSIDGGTVYATVHQSDLVQRISRRRTFKTRVEKVFKGWHHLLLNAVASFAAEHGFREVRVPSSDFAMEHTDPERAVGPELFDRVYDRAVQHRFRAVRSGPWWSIDVAANRAAILIPEYRETERSFERTVCVCHDIERGLGHRDAEPEFSRQAEADSPAALTRMLAVEREAEVRTTYNVVGRIIPEVRDEIETDGHCLAFHSYDHDLDSTQLGACRRVDYRIKGYRPPQSVLTKELRGERLLAHNFEWLASSSLSLGVRTPTLEHRLVKIPILFDDFDLHRKRLTFDEWCRRAIETISRHDFVAFGLHDCYAADWLPHYERLLAEIKSMARLRTMDEVAGDLFITGGI